MKKTKFLLVDNFEIALSGDSEKEYISLTDVCRKVGNDKLIDKWLRNQKTIEFLGVWEKINNPNFKLPEFGGFVSDSGSNTFNLSPKKWIESTAAIGITSKSGRYGGTYAHKDIAFEFCMWISAEFKFLVIKEFQRLKENEAAAQPWKNKRLLASANYRLQTDAIQENIIPFEDRPAGFIFASEADLINSAVFGMTAGEWEKKNQDLASKGQNMRDAADIYQLMVVANMESINSMLITKMIPREQRELQIFSEAKRQLQTFYKNEINKISNF